LSEALRDAAPVPHALRDAGFFQTLIASTAPTARCAEAMMFAEIKDAVEKLASAFETYKSVNDERIKALAGGDTSKAAELGTKLARIETDITKFSDLKTRLDKELELHRERIEELEAAKDRPGKTAADKKANEYKTAFVNWVRARGNSPADEQKMRELEREQKAVDTVSSGGAAGGYGVPTEIAREIERQERKFSPVRDLVKVVTVGTSDYNHLVSIGGAAGAWIGETGTREESATSLLRNVRPTQGELYAYPKASEWSLDDVFFDVAGWLSEEASEVFASMTGVAVIRGDGANKPTGMLNTDPVATEDHAVVLRNAEAYESVAAALDGDGLIDVIYKLNARYRPGASWVMNSRSMGLVRKLKTDLGYLWQPSLQAGQPDSLLGFPVASWEDMPDPDHNEHAIAFGNFKRGYLLVDRVGLRMTRDDITQPGYVKFYVRRRLGGKPLNNDAIKFMAVQGISG